MAWYIVEAKGPQGIAEIRLFIEPGEIRIAVDDGGGNRASVCVTPESVPGLVHALAGAALKANTQREEPK